jgi:hypothetical protein
MFNTMRITLVVLAVALISIVLVPNVLADDWNKATRVTVNQPFRIPGLVLPAGTYLVKIVDLVGERHVVRVLSEDGLKIYATFIGIPDFRTGPTDKASITFTEADWNQVPALRSWFYPGYSYGIEFPQATESAVTVAKAEAEPALEYLPPEFEEWTAPEAPVEEALVEETPAEEPAVVYPEFTPVEEPELGPEFFEPILPRTATPVPLIALIGLLAAGGAATLRWRG